MKSKIILLSGILCAFILISVAVGNLIYKNYPWYRPYIKLIFGKAHILKDINTKVIVNNIPETKARCFKSDKSINSNKINIIILLLPVEGSLNKWAEFLTIDLENRRIGLPDPKGICSHVILFDRYLIQTDHGEEYLPFLKGDFKNNYDPAFVFQSNIISFTLPHKYDLGGKKVKILL